ncbi:MAG: KAP family NTPase [Alphaproteobacteria bacterium]|nr:KAP family NTPase [Alphaproteobacteria bacterium]MBU2082747.1 KAP family NTPase [Alphaproteobacteria bacterium]MBU2143360.1 KAP family NTPase [Alphaproteobacteria bacterium]MBU2196801.1 KAP family NTPase [Alphaproteobacteria bacterium]
MNQDEDKLGYSEPAAHVADAIAHFSSPDGFVLGLEGRWGSGKSSFVNLINNSLLASDPTPEVIRFSPWLISSHDGLLVELFRELASAASRIDLKPAADKARPTLTEKMRLRIGFHKDRREVERQQLTNRLQKFSDHLNRLGALATVAEAFGTPWAGLAARGLRSSGSASDLWKARASLERQKDNLKVELSRLSRKIVIFVDDLDRLAPREAGEVVRLVRAVADFPNVVYVLCYSREILGNSLKKAYGLEEDGAAYIDKIVQVSFSVPKPEDFDLRRMLRHELSTLFPGSLSGDNERKSDDRERRLSRSIDMEGGRSLSSPRDVVRAINAMILYAAPLIDKVDLSDMVWLQLIRIRNLRLYEWIEKYANSWAVISQGAHLTDSGKEAARRELGEILADEKRDDDDAMYELANILPGIQKDYSIRSEGGDQWQLYCGVDDQRLGLLISEKRIGSPDHFRFYFALSKPKGAIEDGDFEELVATTKTDPAAASERLSAMAFVKRSQGGVLAESFVDRLALSADKIPAESLRGIIMALASTMDLVAKQSGRGDWGRYWVWVTANKIFKSALLKVPTLEREQLIDNVFSRGKAIGWLTRILRDELFSHGRTGDRRQPEDGCMFSESELDLVVSRLTERYTNFTIDDLSEVPDAAQVLYAWLQSGPAGKADVNSWVRMETESDVGLLALLEVLRSWAATNDVVHYPLRASSVSTFMDLDVVNSRLSAISSGSNNNLAMLAMELKEAVRTGGDD